MTQVRSSSFQRKIDCPICSNSRKDCRQAGNLLFCRSGETPPGWRFVGEDRLGFGMYAEGEADKQSFDRGEYDRRKAQREAERLAALAGSLPAVDRDSYYRDKTHEARLEPQHRADLERRGLTAEQIAGLPVWSAKGYGYGIAFPDLDGHLHGAQWRVDDAEGGKYIWNAGLPGGQKLAIDEMPIAVYKVANPVMIALVEGTGVKPLIAAQRLNAIAVGAAGGLHNSSPQQLAAVMAAYPGLPVVIVPDAGDLVNAQVMRRHADTAAKLPAAEFLWWGQTTKAENDIDELSGEEIKQISAATFLAFGATKQEAAPAPSTFPVPKWNAECLGYLAQVQAMSGVDLTEAGDRVSKASAKVNGIRKEWAGYQKDFKLSLDPRYNVHTYTDYCPAFEFWQETFILRGGYGSGKTHAIVASLAPLFNSEFHTGGKCAVFVAPTNNLCFNVVARLRAAGIDALHYQSGVAEARDRLAANYTGVIVLCPQSFKEYSAQNIDWTEKTLIIDEFHSVREDLLSNAQSAPHVMRAIAQCGYLVAADANMGNADVGFIENVCGRKKHTRVYLQAATKDPTPVRIVRTLTSESQVASTQDAVKIPLLQQAVLDREAAGSLDPIYLCSDSLLDLRIAQHYLADNYPALVVRRCSSLDVEENPIFMGDPDAALAGVDVLLASPTIQSGADIQKPFFRTLGIFTGTCTPTKAMQHVKRVRNSQSIWLSVPAVSFQTEEAAAKLDRRARNRLAEQADLAFKAAGINAPQTLRDFGIWQDSINKLNRTYYYELIGALVCESFEDVEVILMEGGQTAAFNKIRDQVKAEDVALVFGANRANGYKLNAAKKGPSRDQHIWDMKLAHWHEQYPDLINGFELDYKAAAKAGDVSEEIIGYGKVLLSGKLGKLKNQAIAQSAHADEFLGYMKARVDASNVVTIADPNWKLYKRIRLYRELKLSELAFVRRTLSGKTEEKEEHVFTAKSYLVQGIYNDFMGKEELRSIFSEVEDIDYFWRVVCDAMRLHGHEQHNLDCREETDIPQSNGNYGGKQRYTKSIKVRYIGFFAVKDSGNKVYRRYYPDLFAAAEKWVDIQLESERKWAVFREEQKADKAPPDTKKTA